MENNYYLKPEEILQECLFGVEWIEDVTRRESEENFFSSDEETEEEEEFESSDEIQKGDEGFCLETKIEGKIVEISSDEENYEKESFDKVKKEVGSVKMKTDGKLIEISSDESEEEVLKVSREDESISQESENNIRDDSKTNLKDKVMIMSPPLLPFGWDKMKKEELLEKFTEQNQGKHVPEYLLENLREADYDEEEKTSIVVKNEDKKMLKSKKKKEKAIKKEIKKEKVAKIGNKNIKMNKSEVILHLA